MGIHAISTDSLRRMNDSEGLILQGCGGDLQEWLDGINEMFTENGILTKPCFSNRSCLFRIAAV